MSQAKINDMQERLDEKDILIARMQNVINWAARSASINVAGGKAYFIGHVIGDMKALDNGAPLKG